MNTRYKMMFAAALLMVASCSKEGEVSVSSNSHTITVCASQDNKTQISHADKKYSFAWVVSDAINLMEYVAETQQYQQVSSDPLTKGGNIAAFTASLNPLSKETGQKYHYVAAYPSTGKFELSGWSGSGSEASPNIIVGIPDTQNLPSCTSFDPAADLMVAQTMSVDARPQELNACFARIGGILKIHLTNLPKDASGAYLETGQFSIFNSAYNLAGDFTYYSGLGGIMPYSGGSTSAGGTTGGGTGSASQTIYFVGGPQCPVTNGEADIWLRCCPGTMTGMIDIQLIVNADEVQRIYKKSAEIKGGSGSESGGASTGSASGTGSGSTGTGSGTGGGDAGIVIANGSITAISIALEEEVPPVEPDIEVNILKAEPAENSCGIEALAESKKGGTLPKLDGYVFYSSKYPSSWDPKDFVSDPDTKYQECGETSDGYVATIIEKLNSSTSYYYCVMVADKEKGESYFSTMASFTTLKEKTPVAPVYPISINTSKDTFTAFWDPVTGAKDYECYYYLDGKESDKVQVAYTFDTKENKCSSTASSLADGKYWFIVNPLPDDGYAPCTYDPIPFEFTISSGGGEEKDITISATYTLTTSLMITVTGTVKDSKLWGSSTTKATLYYAEGEVSDLSAIIKGGMKGQSAINSKDGSYSIKTGMKAPTVTTTYSMVVGAGDKYSEIYKLTAEVKK